MAELHINEKLMRILFDRPAIEAAYFAAHRRAAELRQQLRELELLLDPPGVSRRAGGRSRARRTA